MTLRPTPDSPYRRLPEIDRNKPDKRKFKSDPIGSFPIDIAETRTEQGKPHLFVAIARCMRC